MPVNIESLRARLLNLSKEKKIDFQWLLNRLGAEQFLYRLSQSPHAEKFIFKGGSLLTYLIESDRKTKDLDFSVRQITSQVDEVAKIIRSILEIHVDDGIAWKEVEGEPLVHPDMDYPGTRMICRFLFGNMKGVVRMDMAIGDVVEAVRMPLERMKYKGKPIFGEPFSLLVYPPETIFAEKLHISVKKKGQNTRMKDYYDLSRLIDHHLDQRKLKECIQATFANRNLPLVTQIEFKSEELTRLQVYWEHFLKRDKMENLPATIVAMIDKVNAFLKKLYER